MVIFMKANGFWIRLMGMGPICMPMGQRMSENGLKINSMARGLRNGPTEPSMKDTMRMGRNMAMAV
jgi:hypothetical protein